MLFVPRIEDLQHTLNTQSTDNIRLYHHSPTETMGRLEGKIAIITGAAGYFLSKHH